MNKFAAISVLAAGLLSATPALASYQVCVLSFCITLPGNPPVTATLGPVSIGPSGGSSGTPTGGAPSPLLASGIPSLIALGVAAFALRRRNPAEDSTEDSAETPASDG